MNIFIYAARNLFKLLLILLVFLAFFVPAQIFYDGKK